jgi:hypothetical protein
VPEPKCWNDLDSFNEPRYSTFREVAVERGLFADDNEFEAALTEGTLFLMPKQMRSMFLTILLYGHPANSLDLWNKFKEHLCQHSYQSDSGEDLCLELIQQQLRQFGSRLADFN